MKRRSSTSAEKFTILDPKTRTIRCGYYYERHSRCLTEATRFFKISTSRTPRYEARCHLHFKSLVKSFEQDAERFEEISVEQFIIEPVHES